MYMKVKTRITVAIKYSPLSKKNLIESKRFISLLLNLKITFVAVENNGKYKPNPKKIIEMVRAIVPSIFLVSSIIFFIHQFLHLAHSKFRQ